jgi:hypothetical protein
VSKNYYLLPLFDGWVSRGRLLELDPTGKEVITRRNANCSPYLQAFHMISDSGMDSTVEEDVMPPKPIAKIKWTQLESILDRRIWVYYLIILERLADRFRDVIQARPDERFFHELNRHVEAYVNEGRMPPDAIASAVMNVADDVLAGRDVQLKAGDYIALQNYMRGTPH